MKNYLSDPNDELDKENNQHYGEDSMYNGSDDEESGDFNESYNEGFYGDFDDNNNDDQKLINDLNNQTKLKNDRKKI